jgi:serine/threonine protein kinase
MQDNRIIHRDLKPMNIFLTENYEKVKIGDLGVACCINNDQENTNGPSSNEEVVNLEASS